MKKYLYFYFLFLIFSNYAMELPKSGVQKSPPIAISPVDLRKRHSKKPGLASLSELEETVSEIQEQPLFELNFHMREDGALYIPDRSRTTDSDSLAKARALLKASPQLVYPAAIAYLLMKELEASPDLGRLQALQQFSKEKLFHHLEQVCHQSITSIKSPPASKNGIVLDLEKMYVKPCRLALNEKGLNFAIKFDSPTKK